ncbi:MAG: hypothetical protein NWE91_08720 [Candidatus Bathyarchaeota archaeon]|nr:hypothetical protein [Candidatus Bathyarchaeota archaeon]
MVNQTLLKWSMPLSLSILFWIILTATLVNATSPPATLSPSPVEVSWYVTEVSGTPIDNASLTIYWANSTTGNFTVMPADDGAGTYVYDKIADVRQNPIFSGYWNPNYTHGRAVCDIHPAGGLSGLYFYVEIEYESAVWYWPVKTSYKPGDPAWQPVNASESPSGYAAAGPGIGTGPTTAYPTQPTPEVESSDLEGERAKDSFGYCESVYAYGSGYAPSTTYPIYVVNDTTWTNGMDIPDPIDGTAENVTTDGNGDIAYSNLEPPGPPPALIWPSAVKVTGAYDVIVDVNNDGLYNETIDALDDNDVDGAGFEVLPLPVIESSDFEGNRKDVFDKDESVYVYGSNYAPYTTYPIYVVNDTTWTNGMDIPDRVDGTAENVTTDGNGDIAYSNLEGSGTPPALIWESARSGEFDIVVDVNRDRKYNKSCDPLDDLDVNDAGFTVVGGVSVSIKKITLPASWISPIIVVSAVFAAASIKTLYKRKHKAKHTPLKPVEKS